MYLLDAVEHLCESVSLLQACVDGKQAVVWIV